MSLIQDAAFCIAITTRARGSADVVLGSRLLGEHPIRQGMPWWKYIANRALTWLENVTFDQRLSEYHTGYRGYSRHALETVNFEMIADGFVFDQEILAQLINNSGLRITEVPPRLTRQPRPLRPVADRHGLLGVPATHRYGSPQTNRGALNRTRAAC